MNSRKIECEVIYHVQMKIINLISNDFSPLVIYPH
jgi:hypothetical protein